MDRRRAFTLTFNLQILILCPEGLTRILINVNKARETIGSSYAQEWNPMPFTLAQIQTTNDI